MQILRIISQKFHKILQRIFRRQHEVVHLEWLQLEIDRADGGIQHEWIFHCSTIVCTMAEGGMC